MFVVGSEGEASVEECGLWGARDIPPADIQHPCSEQRRGCLC